MVARRAGARAAGANIILAAIVFTVALWGRSAVAGEPQVQIVARGLEVPWALAFAPDGRLFVTERPGRVRVVKAGQLEPTPIATLRVTAVGEAGLMGLALDPDFAQNGHLFVCYTAPATGGLFGGGVINRVLRLTLRESGVGDERVILDRLPGASIHDGCRLKFGPDGKLYVTTGDAAEPRLSQRMDSLAGKILRLNADGSVPPDNPFPGSPIYSLGHRNPQGLAWDGAGRLFAAEHGPSGHDEVNWIRPGRNYGWPEVAGKGGEPRYVDPLIESGSDTWAPSGIAILGTDLFVAGLRGRRLLRIVLGPDLNVQRVEALLAGTYGRLREVVVRPDGTLYVTTSNRDGPGSPAPDDDRILHLAP